MRQEFSLKIIDDCGVITDISLGDTLAPRFNWKPGHSARVQARKILENLTNLGKITKHEGFYRSLNCRSEFSEHSKALSQHITQLYQLPEITPHIRREISFDCGIRSDVAAILVRGNQARCIIVEVDLTETKEQLEAKYNQWMRWKDAHSALEKVLGYQVDNFDFLSTSGRVGLQFTSYIKEISNGS